MTGKREQPNKRSRLPVILAVIAACILLAAVSGRFGTAPKQPPAEEPPVQEAPVVPEVPVEEAEPVLEPEPLPEEPEEELVAGIPGLPPLDAPIDPEKPMIAITFDDGPGPYTNRLLDAFATYGGKGTFFLVGRNIAAHAETVQRAAAEGHEIASHSWSHPELTKISKAVVVEQMTKTRNKIQEVTGTDAKLMRPPYGAVNKSVKATAAEQGIVLVNWSVDPKDWQSRDADKVYEAILKYVQDGDIILCHDIHESTVEAMERLIPELRVQGYQLVTVTELLTSQGAEIKAGTLYRERPEKPAEEEAPAEPETPAQPVAPPAPSTPVPTVPAEPVTPAPETPVVPVEPTTPTPVNPVVPAPPEEPATVTPAPEGTDVPLEPEVPVEPAQPPVAADPTPPAA